MDETLLERYRRDPFAVTRAIELAARRERARVIKEFLVRAAEALFGQRPKSRDSRVAGREWAIEPETEKARLITPSPTLPLRKGEG